MNNTQHTPGPWNGNTKNPLGTHIYAKGKHIAIVESEEDAHLIAAAPDMYEALMQAAFAIPTTHGAFETIRAALAKAKGEQS